MVASLLVGAAVALRHRISPRRAHEKSSATQSVDRRQSRWAWQELDSKILTVFLPAVANLMLIPLVGAVDLFWVGRLGDPLAIAGMGAANQVYSMIYFIISFLPAVVTPRIAKEVSQGNTSAATSCVCEALYFGLVLGTIGSFCLVACPQQVMAIISRDPAVLLTAVPYLRFRGLTLICTLWSTIGFATFRGLLDFSTPLKVSLFANLVNVVLDPILMYTMGLGVTGAALATAFSDFVSCAFFVFLLRRRGFLSKLSKIPSFAQLKPLLASGLAVQVRSFATNAMFIAAVRRVTAIDPTGVQAAAYQVTMQFWSLAGYALLALSTAGAGLIPSDYYGEGVDAARTTAYRLLHWGWTLGVVLGILQLLAVPLLSLATPIKEVQQAIRVPSVLAALLQILNGVVFAGEGILLGMRAYGWLATSSVMGCLSMIVMISLAQERALIGVWIGFFGFNLCRLIGSTLYLNKFGPLAPANADTPSELVKSSS